MDKSKDFVLLNNSCELRGKAKLIKGDKGVLELKGSDIEKIDVTSDVTSFSIKGEKNEIVNITFRDADIASSVIIYDISLNNYKAYKSFNQTESTDNIYKIINSYLYDLIYQCEYYIEKCNSKKPVPLLNTLNSLLLKNINDLLELLYQNYQLDSIDLLCKYYVKVCELFCDSIYSLHDINNISTFENLNKLNRTLLKIANKCGMHLMEIYNAIYISLSLSLDNNNTDKEILSDLYQYAFLNSSKPVYNSKLTSIIMRLMKSNTELFLEAIHCLNSSIDKYINDLITSHQIYKNMKEKNIDITPITNFRYLNIIIIIGINGNEDNKIKTEGYIIYADNLLKNLIKYFNHLYSNFKNDKNNLDFFINHSFPMYLCYDFIQTYYLFIDNININLSVIELLSELCNSISKLYNIILPPNNFPQPNQYYKQNPIIYPINQQLFDNDYSHNGFNVNTGYEFTLNKPLIIYAIGRGICNANNGKLNSTHIIKIKETEGEELISVSINDNDPRDSYGYK